MMVKLGLFTYQLDKWLTKAEEQEVMKQLNIWERIKLDIGDLRLDRAKGYKEGKEVELEIYLHKNMHKNLMKFTYPQGHDKLIMD